MGDGGDDCTVSDDGGLKKKKKKVMEVIGFRFKALTPLPSSFLVFICQCK